jgi:transcription initiation factor TFIIIB Brf1 subunit/transcription initiation factor TFIIB
MEIEASVTKRMKKEPKPIFPNVLRTPRERAMKRARDDLWYLCDLLLIKEQSLKEEVLRLYSLLYEKGLTERKNRLIIIGALIYFVASRQSKHYLILDDIAKVTYSNNKKIWETLIEICNELKMNFVPPDPEIGIIRFGTLFSMNAEEITLAMQIFEEARLRKVVRWYADVLDVITSLYLASKLYSKFTNNKAITRKEIIDRFPWIDLVDLDKNILFWEMHIDPRKILEIKTVKEIIDRVKNR